MPASLSAVAMSASVEQSMIVAASHDALNVLPSLEASAAVERESMARSAMSEVSLSSLATAAHGEGGEVVAGKLVDGSKR